VAARHLLAKGFRHYAYYGVADTLYGKLREAGFSKMHVFRYSPRPGTRAASLDPLDPGVVVERSERMRRVAKELQDAFADDRVGAETDVVIEDVLVCEGRTWARGTTREYLKVRLPGNALVTGDVVRARLLSREAGEVLAEPLGKA
jgi:threonylcarbamoyladenosine tRNA methylthiotransferase MtaB